MGGASLLLMQYYFRNNRQSYGSDETAFYTMIGIMGMMLYACFCMWLLNEYQIEFLDWRNYFILFTFIAWSILCLSWGMRKDEAYNAGDDSCDYSVDHKCQLSETIKESFKEGHCPFEKMGFCTAKYSDLVGVNLYDCEN